MASDIDTFMQNAPAVWAFNFHSNAWTQNTGVLLGAGDGFEVYPQGSPRQSTGPAANNAIFGNRLSRANLVATHKVEGPYTCPWLFHGLQRQVGAFFGAEAKATASGGTAIDHTFTPAANSPYIGNLAWEDRMVCHDYPAVKFQSVTLRCNQGEIGEVVLAPYGRRELIDGSGLNTTSTMDSVTLPTQPAIKYVQNAASILTCLMNTSAGSALSVLTDEYNLVGFEVTFTRQWRERFDSSNLPYPSEPVCGTMIQVSGSLSFSLWADETGEVGTSEWLQIINQTKMKARITLQGTSIGGSPEDYYSWIINLPYLQFSTDGIPQFNTPGAPEVTLNFMASEELSTPSGMSYPYPYVTVRDENNSFWLS